MKNHIELYEKLNVKSVAISLDGGTTRFPPGEFDKIFDYINQLKKENEELKKYMYVDDDPCRIDHNGDCQTHHIGKDENGRCAMIRIRELLENNEK